MSFQTFQSPAALERMQAETVPLPDSGDNTPSSHSPSKQATPGPSNNGTATNDVAPPEIIISPVGSETGSSPGVGASSSNSINADPLGQKKDKYMDPNDKTNDGDVVQNFFTSNTRNRPHSPVSTESGCYNPRFNQDSDLYIKARDKDNKLYVFEVNSTVLEKASHKFENMIYSTHVRGNKEEWVWELSDNPLGLKIMFCLLHNKFPQAMLITKPRASQLYTVFRVLEKYEIGLETTNLHLLAKSWVEAFRKSLPSSKLSHVQALYVAHKLGDFKSLKETIRKVAHDVSIGDDGSLSDEDGRSVQEIVPIAKELLENIESIRGKDIEAVLKSLKDPYEYLMDAEKSNGKNYCKSVDGHLECNQKLLGSLLSNLLQQKLFPVPDSQGYNGSFNSLAEKINKMEIRGLFYPGVEMHKQRHTICKLGQDVVVKKLREGMEVVPLSDDIIEHMYVMSKRCGRFREERSEFSPYKNLVRDLHLLDREALQNDIWGWLNPDNSDTESDVENTCNDEDSGLFDVTDTSVWIERKVSTDLETKGTLDA